MKSIRPYTMTTRARSVARTRTRILDATVTLHTERPIAEVSLADIAEWAGVSVQTVLRHFGSRDELMEAASEHARQAVERERRAPVGDVDEAVRVLIDHYERRGDGVLLLLDQERSHDLVRRITDRGRELHRQWVEQVFAPYLADAEEPEALAELLVVTTDVYVWRLLRRDRGLSRERTESLVRQLVGALVPTLP